MREQFQYGFEHTAKMDSIFYEGQVLWAQLDANRHMRHSAYADVCAQARSNMLSRTGLSFEGLAKQGIGPVLFREELVYHREIGLDEFIRVRVEMTKFNTANGRFSFRHEIYKADGTKAATVRADGAWLDLEKRKLTVLPAEWTAMMQRMPKAEDYEEVSGDVPR